MKTRNQLNVIQVGLMLFSIFMIFTPKTNLAQVNTKQLEKQAENKIANEYNDTYKISVDTKGIMTIEGEVKTLYDKLNIGELISRIDGVQKIINKITVQVEPTADNVIKDNIENEFQLNNIILEPEKIKVQVNNGVVNLSGTVSYFREKLMAQSIASWQDGVTDMTSDIQVMSPSLVKSDNNLKDIIADILHKSFPMENNIKFDINKGNVKLYGTTKNIYAKNHIIEEIHHVLGINDVTDEISLEKLEE